MEKVMSAVKQRPAKSGSVAKIKTTTTVKRASYNFDEVYEPEVTENEQQIEVPVFDTHPATVRVSASVTKNTGNYNSIKVQVDVTLPCYPEGSEIDRAYDICSAWVNQKIQDEVSYAFGREENPPAQETH